MNETMPTPAETQAPVPNEMIEVPDWVRNGGPAPEAVVTPEIAEKTPLRDAQKKVAVEAIQSTLGATDSAEKDPDEATPSVDDLRVKRITVIDAQPVNPPKKKHFWQR